MALQALVLSQDDEVLRQIRAILHDLGIGIDICAGPAEALNRASRHKYEVAVVDSEAAGDLQTVLTSIRSSDMNHSTVTCVIARAAADNGAVEADVVISRPFSIEQAWRSFRSARSMMEREQRRYFRAPVTAPAKVQLADGTELEAQLRNVSINGIAVEKMKTLAAGTEVQVCFRLPSQQDTIEACGEIAWSNADGSTGIRLLVIESDSMQRLEAWITQLCREREFAFVGCPVTSLPNLSKLPSPGPPVES